jgi:hypothetical protein
VKGWAQQFAGAALVLVFAAAIGGFVLLLRAQQVGLAATMASAHIRAVSPPDGATNVPLDGEIRAEYFNRPANDPTLKLEPPVGVTLDNPHWDGTTFVIDYHGLRDNSLYHVELDQDDWTGKGEHKQVKVRWSFRTGSIRVATPTPTVSLPPTPAPTTSVAPTPSPPTATPDLIWYNDQTPGTMPGHVGLDWQGQPVRAIKWVGTTQSPDGRWIYNSMTPSTWVYDALGNRAGSMAGLSPSMWADDSQQFCGITYQTATAPRSLVTMPLDGSVRPVAPIALADSAGKPVQQLLLAACSDLNSRAMVVGASNGYIWSMAMISLADGSIIFQTRYPNPLKRLTASHDGRYVAEQLAGNANGSSTTLIRELPTGKVLGQLTGIAVEGFSWDGSLVAGGLQGNAGLTGAEVIRWQTHQVIWNQCGCPSPFDVRVIAQPGGTKLAIAATDQRLEGSFTIIDAGGAALSAPVGKQPFSPLF